MCRRQGAELEHALILATFARGLSPATGRDVVTTVSAALDRIAASLLAEVDQVEAPVLTS